MKDPYQRKTTNPQQMTTAATDTAQWFEYGQPADRFWNY